MRKLLLCLSLGLFTGILQAQDEAVLRAAMYLSGASSEEEIPADWIERLESVRRVRINSPTLRSGVLLSDYQVACIRDYRSSSGDILSFEELALVDGFSHEAVAALKPFLSLESDRLPGQADTTRLRATALVRGTLSTFGTKGKVDGEYWRAGAAWRGGNGSFYAEGEWRRSRVLLGHFHTRWGQGLAAWTGFSMESLSTVDAFIRRGGGLSPVWSYAPSGVHRGLAYEYSGRYLRASAYAGLGNDYGVHADWLGRNGQAGLSVLLAQGLWSFSLDGRYNLRGLDLAGEFAFRNRSFAGKAAARGRLGESWKWAAQARVIPRAFSRKRNGEYGLGAGMSYLERNRYTLSLTADSALLPIPDKDPRRFQLRVYGIWQWQYAPGWMLDLRLTERYRNYEAPRTDVRADAKYTAGPWLGTLRLETDHCGGWGFLTYLEGGYKQEKVAAYLRVTGFWADVWAARLYCYERDAPGAFLVPAYYGRGMAASAVASCKFRLWRLRLKANARLACQFRLDKAPAYTLNLQLQADL